MSKLTVAILNWKRPENLTKLIQALCEQAERPVIYLWDNGTGIPTTTLAVVDWYVQSSTNKQCIPRWWLAMQAPTPYVATFDDDLMPSDANLLKDLVESLDKEPDKYRIHGAFGKILQPSLPYEQCPASAPGEACDIVLGRVMAMRTNSLRRCLDWKNIVSNEWGTVDDIFVSGMFANYGRGERMHLCSKVFEGRLVELPDDYALCKEEGHFKRREQARRTWFDK